MLASDAIKAALREGNLISISATPTDAQNTEGLTLLNGILAATPGWAAGGELADLNYGGTYDESAVTTTYLPADVRLVLNLSAAASLNLHPKPYDGQRLALVDSGNNLATYNLVLSGNGRTIEGAATLTLSTSGSTRQWLYRADLGDWKRLTDLVLADSLPFPSEFDQYFAVLLAMRMNPRYGQELQQGSALWLEQMSNQLEARYRKPRPPAELGTAGLLGGSPSFLGTQADFNAGRVWPI